MLFRSQYPCFVIAPQCPAEEKWVDADWDADSHIMKDKPAVPLDVSIELVHQMLKEHPIDRARIYVVGYSMGGFGAWDCIERWPDIFAAAVPVCGGGDETKAGRIARMPIWAFHGALDPTVKVSRSRNMILAVVMAGGLPRYSEYPAINHFSWGLAFSDSELFKWLFSQKK